MGHDRPHVEGCDAVTASTAIPESNIERRHAAELGIPTMRRAGMLASICALARTVAVAGTHGKTTTTSMLMLVLAEAGLPPSFVVGGDVTDAGTGAQWTGSELLVVEADESDGTHLELPLYATVLTNVEVDHLDHYGIVRRHRRQLRPLPRRTSPGRRCSAPTTARCADWPAARRRHVRAARRRRLPRRRRHADRRLVPLRRRAPRRRRSGTIDLPLRGVHNVVNATGVVAMATELGVPFAAIAAALARFGGVARRFDIRGVDGGATFVDDYAHLPSEIAAVLAGARESGDGWHRVIAVFQPNRFNRMSEISGDYADAFVDADVVVLTEIYSSGTTPIPGVTGQLVVDAVLEAHPDAHVVWLPRRDDMVSFLAGEVGPGDVCISMGCGDIATLPEEVLARRARGAAPSCCRG